MYIEYTLIHTYIGKKFENTINFLVSSTFLLSETNIQYRNCTFIGPSKPFKLPRRNLVAIAIQKFTLRPKRVLKITIRKKKKKRRHFRRVREDI